MDGATTEVPCWQVRETPFEQMPPPCTWVPDRGRCCSHGPAAGAVAGRSPADTEADNGSGALLDAAVLDASCLSNTCEGYRPDHLIEYFSADWCEPCEQVSEQLRNLTNPHHVVLQHHPSPEDSTFLSASKLRNDADYRLLFLPSLVIDGEHLLTGTRQAMDMNLKPGRRRPDRAAFNRSSFQ